MINQIAKNFKKVGYALRNVGNVFAMLFANSFNENNDLVKLQSYHLTNYICPRCGGRLAIHHHTSNEIFYVCCGCDKIHKARKNMILGRF